MCCPAPSRPCRRPGCTSHRRALEVLYAGGHRPSRTAMCAAPSRTPTLLWARPTRIVGGLVHVLEAPKKRTHSYCYRQAPQHATTPIVLAEIGGLARALAVAMLSPSAGTAGAPHCHPLAGVGPENEIFLGRNLARYETSHLSGGAATASGRARTPGLRKINTTTPATGCRHNLRRSPRSAASPEPALSGSERPPEVGNFPWFTGVLETERSIQAMGRASGRRRTPGCGLACRLSGQKP